MDYVHLLLNTIRHTPSSVLGAFAASAMLSVILSVYIVLYFFAPNPRPPYESEKTYTFVTEEGTTRRHHQLPCWYDAYVAEKEAALAAGRPLDSVRIRAPEVFLSLVVPAYNEEERMGIMLTEAVAYLEQHYGSGSAAEDGVTLNPSKKSKHKKGKSEANIRSASPNPPSSTPAGYEIIIVSDGSTDRTVEVALAFAKKQLPAASRPNLRVVTLEQNRGKGGAVTHGLRHVRGAYALFADADGATRFSDLGAVLDAARAIELASVAPATTGSAQASENRQRGSGTVSVAGGAPLGSDATSVPEPGARPAVSVGSRAHMVNTPAVVKRSALRNLLMRGFHVFLKLMTPPRTAKIGDTQCGFKLFSRGALPAIVPWMHSEGWIFDVEMLMLAESAGVPVAEVPVGWKEIGGSKLNVVWDSLGMAWGLAVLRGAWLLGIYRRTW